MKKYYTELKWAGINFGMYLVWMLLERLFGLHGPNIQHQQLVSTFILIPSLLIYVLALREKKRKVFQGKITFGQAFKSGMVLTILIVLFSPVNQLIITQLVSPEYFKNMRDLAVAKGMSPEEARSRLNTGAFIVQSVVGGLVTGALFSALVSVVIRSKK
ncbi:DUF4199 family protein [Chitinophaga sp. SYP-B3965]|uniref:DUF4199 domain-containing protein n=1 Tax=Chitinophaga sp. SYP-B3965 TaxID=2663120 RepID=UPI001299A27E|nr:DUF4199 domain-containing protein [Chitinophaga sp. SYP-B3965]MRG45700.1 DUF4199 family protein [Chitinophaga sp. SYP-B3965]